MNVDIKKQPSRGVLEKWCSENMQQIYRKTPMPKCDFKKFKNCVSPKCICSSEKIQHLNFSSVVIFNILIKIKNNFFGKFKKMFLRVLLCRINQKKLLLHVFLYQQLSFLVSTEFLENWA